GPWIEPLQILGDGLPQESLGLPVVVVPGAEWPVEATGEVEPQDVASGQEVELELKLALLQHRLPAVDLRARLVVLDQGFARRPPVHPIDLSVNSSAGDR